MKVVFALAVLALFVGCASAPQHHRAAWAGLKMSGLTLALEDPKIREWLNFFDDGMVAATVGQRNGYVAGPAFEWRITGEWLEIDTTGNRKFRHRMRPVTVLKHRIIVEDPTGRKSVYKYSEHH